MPAVVPEVLSIYKDIDSLLQHIPYQKDLIDIQSYG